MNLQTLRELYVNQLRDIYDSENQIIAVLLEMESAAHHESLKMALSKHHTETRQHIQRLDQIFEALGENPHGTTCTATEGLIKEGKEIIAATGDSRVMDAGLIAVAQKIEHHQIANYGTVATYAKELGEKNALNLLLKTLDEEKKTDKLLTKLAKHAINEEALHTYAPINYNSTDDVSRIAALGLLVGFASGLAAGILLAPNTGTTLRKQIGAMTNKLSESAKDNISEYSHKTKQAIEHLGKAISSYAYQD